MANLRNAGGGNKLVRTVGSLRIWVAILSMFIGGVIAAVFGIHLLTKKDDVPITITVIERSATDVGYHEPGTCWFKGPDGRTIVMKNAVKNFDLGSCTLGTEVKVVKGSGGYRKAMSRAESQKMGRICLIVSAIMILLAFVFYRFRHSTTLAGLLLLGNIMD